MMSQWLFSRALWFFTFKGSLSPFGSNNSALGAVLKYVHAPPTSIFWHENSKRSCFIFSLEYLNWFLHLLCVMLLLLVLPVTAVILYWLAFAGSTVSIPRSSDLMCHSCASLDEKQNRAVASFFFHSRSTLVNTPSCISLKSATPPSPCSRSQAAVSPALCFTTPLSCIWILKSGPTEQRGGFKAMEEIAPV